MQEGFKYHESEVILPNIVRLKKMFNGKTVFAKFTNKKGSLFESQLKWTKFQNEDDKKLFTELQSPGNIEFYHEGYTVLGKDLIKFIKDNRIGEVYICGVYTDVCVTKTAMDLFDNNIKAFVIEDACNSLHGKSYHDSAIETLKHILGKQQIISTDDACSR